MKKNKLVLLSVFVLIITAIPVNAITVFDPSNYRQNVKQVAEAITQTKKAIETVENQLKNLTKISDQLSYRNIKQIQNQLVNLITNIERAKALTYQYEQLQQQWDMMYPNYKQYNGKSAQEMAEEAQKIMEQTSLAMADAARIQALISSGMTTDHQVLQSLLDATRTAPGALAAAQAGNQIAALQIEQLMKIQALMVANSRAQTMYMMEQYQKKKMEEEELNKSRIKERKDIPEKGISNQKL